MQNERIGLIVPVLACVWLAVGCAGASTLAPAAGFSQTLGRANPLTGRVYQSAARRFVTPSELRDAVEGAQYLVLGETHDNRDHHALEALLTQWFLDAHPGATVGFEMLDERVRDVLRAPPRDPDALARAVHWQDSGWPEFSMYRPVFEVALRAGAPILAAHPSPEHVHASMAGLPEAEASRLHLGAPLPEAARAQLAREIREGHCGYANDAMVDAMEHMQRYKDAFMAKSLFDAGGPAVLVSGRGHARTDRAVPYQLQLLGAAGVLSVAFVDVDDAATKPEDYDVAPFDFVVFTPRVSDVDPCARFREQLERMRGHGAQPAPSAPDATDQAAPPAGSERPQAVETPPAAG